MGTHAGLGAAEGAAKMRHSNTTHQSTTDPEARPDGTVRASGGGCLRPAAYLSVQAQMVGPWPRMDR
ncbi:MAG: hypothetical protein IH803_03585 [Nitrospirae bacterium]|nr:hypothetical protein [Nitrospirota bacterium]